jgi:hypothetical protein
MDSEKPRYSALDANRSMTSPANSARGSLVARASLCSQSVATNATKVLIGSFPDHGKSDPEVFSRQVIDLFMQYPEAVVAIVAKSMPLRVKFFPSLSEVREALDDTRDPGAKFRIPDSRSTPNTFRDDPPLPETTSEYRTNVIRRALGYLPETCHPIGETDGPGRSNKQVPDREYRRGKVYENGKLVSEKFGEWNGQPCIAENDPVRLGEPKGWKGV